MTKQLSRPDLEVKAVSITEDRFLDPQHAAVSYGFFGRVGGVSQGIYSSLNCGAGSDDDYECVAKNYEIVGEKIGVGADQIVCLHQIHSDICHRVRAPWALKDRPKGDAMVSDVPGMALGVLSADCASVLFYAEKADGSPVIGAAHAGWRGAIGGVLQATVQGLLELGAQELSVRACVGPCIGKRSYEVSLDFYKAFLERDAQNEIFFMSGTKDGHFMFDLAGYCTSQLAYAGVRHVSVLDVDTYTQEERFFSYRRTTHRKETDYGRQISVVAIHD